ncbi:MAG TPA: alpha/beta hydrolase [Candidatus Sulfomarinibacteraceae bacterium]|nr:alpha/beta hydrolase [Candidatus Sulfomarinibacteraceae bacterium]
MKRAIRWILLGFVSLLLLLLAGSFINHRLRIPGEEAAYPPPGQLAPVNDHRLHVYGEGEGPVTLVFLAGSGTATPTLDFRGLYSRLSDEYRIAVVERAGYGWSDEGETSRDIDTVLNETRTALQRAGERPPYVLFPHSMSGLEALYWASLYPDEVAAIVGLDPAVPQAYEDQPPPRAMLAAIAFASRSGLIRLAPSVCMEAPAVSQGHLTAEETAAFCSLIYRRTLTANMLAEVAATQANAELVAAQGIPAVPLYFFISDGEELPLDNWGEILATYVEEADDGRYLVLDVGHYVHNLAADVIAEESRAFIGRVVGGR